MYPGEHKQVPLEEKAPSKHDVQSLEASEAQVLQVVWHALHVLDAVSFQYKSGHDDKHVVSFGAGCRK